MRLKQILPTLLGICFIVFAALQYNDPDAVPWIATYLAAAILSFLTAFNRISRAVLLLAFVAFAVGAVYFWPEQWEGLAIGGGDIQNIEEARESLGLALCSLTMLGYAFLSKSSVRLHPQHTSFKTNKRAS